jgi:CRISPR-associated protein Cmr1
MRKLPTENPPQVTPDLNQRRAGSRSTPLITLVRRYELITPLFGGGVEPGVADPVTVIRGSEIRGHLRFWWRACRGGQFGGSLARMKEAEDLLWGAASTPQKPRPSQVHIDVEITNHGQEEQPFQTRTRASQNWRDLAYAAFPLQEAHGKVRTGVNFTLTLTFPQSQQAEVEAALWAWETFGGIGARTRRGFGALRNLDSSPPQPNGIQHFIEAGLQQHVTAGTWPSGVPHLSHNVALMKITAAHPDSRAAWKHLIRRLKDFRQSRPGPPNNPGRSHWPEPDEVRRKTGQHLKAPHRNHAPVHPAGDVFPRAAFGLPIIFHFKDMNRNNPDDPDADPRDTTLRGASHDRFASPLILRPLVCSGGQAVGLAVILRGPSIPPLVLKDAPGNPPVRANLTPTEASTIPPLDGKVDVLQAFLATLD